MSQVRTISGIPDDLWKKAEKEYETISGGIKNLLQEDLRTEDENEEHTDLLKNSDLTNKQIKVAKQLMKEGGLEKNPQQLGSVLRNHYAEKEYREKCRKDIIKIENVPFEKKGKGIKAIDTECGDCEVSIPLQVLRKTSFECPQCDTRLYDID